MPIPGAIFESRIGHTPLLGNLSSLTTYAMAALNTGWCARFTALTTKDIKSVLLAWSAVVTPGTVQLRIETVDAATGKPSGTLYDANATYNITPAAGLQTYTFATLPTTGMVVGNEYAVVLLTTAAGTTQTLRSYLSTGGTLSCYPISCLTAADGTVRSNFAEQATSLPMCSFVLEDDSEDSMGLLAYTGVSTNRYAYSTTAQAAKVTLATAHKLAGVVCDTMARIGTPAGDIRCRIFDSSDNVVANTTVTADKDSLTNVNARAARFYFPAVVELAAGTYRVVFDSAASVNASNAFGIRSLAFMSAGAVAANFYYSSTADVTATPITWTDSSTDHADVALLLDAEVVSAGGGGLLTHPGMTGGIRG